MKIYLKTLAITAGIQIVGFMLAFLLDGLLSRLESSTIAPVYIGGFFVLLSMIIGFALPAKWCETRGKMALTILLLPTNYTWLVLAIAVIKFVGNILNILKNIPANFG